MQGTNLCHGQAEALCQRLAKQRTKEAELERRLATMTNMLASAVASLEKQEALVAEGNMQFARLAQLEALAAEVKADLVAKKDFKTEQAKLLAKLACRSESVPAILKEAQACSASRSPSAAAFRPRQPSLDPARLPPGGPAPIPPGGPRLS